MCVEINLMSELSSSQDEADAIFQRLTGRWVLQILIALSDRQMRFSSLRRAIPKLSANVLTARLRELESAQLVMRTMLPAPASCQVYQLGPLAEDLRPALDHLDRWRKQLPSLLEAFPI